MYLVIDAQLRSGTGIRDYYNSNFINPNDLNLSIVTVQRINKWLAKYEEEHYNGYKNDVSIIELDAEGKEIALTIKNEIVDVKVVYFSDARMTSEMI